jgi:hypothetical protein
MRIVGIDPGLDGAAASLFVDGILLRAEGQEFKTEQEEGKSGTLARMKREQPPFDPRVRLVIDYLCDRAAQFCFAGPDPGDATKCVIALEIPPPFQYGRTGNRNNYAMQQLRWIVGGLFDRLSNQGYKIHPVYPVQWKPLREDEMATVRRIRQAVVTGAIKAVPGLVINKTPPDIWSSIGIGSKVSSDLEFQGRSQ